MNAASPIPNDHPLKQAWDAYKVTEDYSNSLYWSLRLMPFIQAGMPESDRKQIECGPLSYEQRLQHVQGALWAAFMAGWNARDR